MSLPENFIGIASFAPALKLVWAINNDLGISLSKTLDFQILNKKNGQKTPFTTFAYTDDLNKKHYLIANKSKGVTLLPKIKTIDFIYISNTSGDKLQEINKNLHQSEIIRGSFILPLDNKSTKLLIPLFEE